MSMLLHLPSSSQSRAAKLTEAPKMDKRMTVQKTPPKSTGGSLLPTLLVFLLSMAGPTIALQAQTSQRLTIKTPPSPVVATQGQYFELSLRAEPGPATLELVGFPQELRFEADVGLLKGTPGSAGEWKLSVLAKSQTDIDTATVTLKVLPGTGAGAVKTAQGSGAAGSTPQASQSVPSATNQPPTSYSGTYVYTGSTSINTRSGQTQVRVRATLTFDQAANNLEVSVFHEDGPLKDYAIVLRYSGNLQGNIYLGTAGAKKLTINGKPVTTQPTTLKVEFRRDSAIGTGTSGGKEEIWVYKRLK